MKTELIPFLCNQYIQESIFILHIKIDSDYRASKSFGNVSSSLGAMLESTWVSKLNSYRLECIDHSLSLNLHIVFTIGQHGPRVYMCAPNSRIPFKPIFISNKLRMATNLLESHPHSYRFYYTYIIYIKPKSLPDSRINCLCIILFEMTDHMKVIHKNTSVSSGAINLWCIP